MWEELAPRLLHPTKLAFIKALLKSGEPLSLAELAEVAKIAKDHAEYHCKRMSTAGVLEVVNVVVRKEDEGEEQLYFFPSPVEPGGGAPFYSRGPVKVKYQGDRLIDAKLLLVN